MQHDLDGRGELAVQRRSGEAAGGGEGLHARRHLLRRVGVHGARAALVTGVQRREQLAAPPRRGPRRRRAGRAASATPAGPGRAARPRPPPRCSPAGTPAGRRADAAAQLGHVLDGDDAFTRPHEAQERAQDRGLAGARAAGDEERQAGFEYGAHQASPRWSTGPERAGRRGRAWRAAARAATGRCRRRRPAAAPRGGARRCRRATRRRTGTRRRACGPRRRRAVAPACGRPRRR